MAGSEDVYVLSKYIDEWLQDPSAYDSDAKALVEGVRGLERDLAASEDRERQHKAALDAMRIERDYARMRLDRHAAHLADEEALVGGEQNAPLPGQAARDRFAVASGGRAA